MYFEKLKYTDKKEMVVFRNSSVQLLKQLEYVMVHSYVLCVAVASFEGET